MGLAEEGRTGDVNARRTCSDKAELVPSDNERDIRGRGKMKRKEGHGKNCTEITVRGWKSETLGK